MPRNVIRGLTVAGGLLLGIAIAATPSGVFKVYPTYAYFAEFLPIPRFLLPVLAAAVFMLWSRHLLSNGPDPGRLRSYVLAAVTVPLSIALFVFQWRWAETYIPSMLYTAVLLSITAFAAAAIAGVHAAKRRAAGATLTADWLLFFWLLIYAFPFLGEPI